MDDALLDVVSQVITNSYEQSQLTHLIVPAIAQREDFNSSHYEELTTFNLEHWFNSTIAAEAGELDGSIEDYLEESYVVARIRDSSIDDKAQSDVIGIEFSEMLKTLNFEDIAARFFASGQSGGRRL